MAVSNLPIFPQTIVTTPMTIVAADTTTLKTLYTAGTNGSKLEYCYVTNTDTNAYTINLYITISATNYLIGTINLPASSGNTTSAPALNIFANTNLPAFNTDAGGNKYLMLASGAALKAATTGTVTAAKTIAFLTQGGDY
jgi:hypothetical protein